MGLQKKGRRGSRQFRCNVLDANGEEDKHLRRLDLALDWM